MGQNCFHRVLPGCCRSSVHSAQAQWKRQRNSQEAISCGCLLTPKSMPRCVAGASSCGFLWYHPKKIRRAALDLSFAQQDPLNTTLTTLHARGLKVDVGPRELGSFRLRT